MSFDIERFVSLSKAVDTHDLDWDALAHVGVTDEEARILRYMADVENHTIINLRDLLAGHSARDTELLFFLACWVYEETQHGFTIDRILAVCGHPADKRRYTKIVAAPSFRESLEAFLSRAAAAATPHFAATHMIWGALNEMTAALAYTALARFTKNAELGKLLQRLAKDERRHQSYYYHQAQRRLAASAVARRIARFALERFWHPVGLDIGDAETFGLIAAMLFDNEWGRDEFAAIDRAIAKLPGMQGLNLVTARIPPFGAAFKKQHPRRVWEHSVAAYTP